MKGSMGHELEGIEDFVTDADGEFLGIDVGIHGLDVHLVATVLHAYEAEVVAVEELGVTGWAALADGLFEEEAVGGLGEDAIEAVVGGEGVIGLQGAVEGGGGVGYS